MKPLNRNKGMIRMKNPMLILVAIAALSAASCSDLLDINSTRAVSEENMWQSMEDTRGALMGVYGLTRAALADNNVHWLYGDVRPGEFVSPNRQDLRAIVENNLTASYPAMEAARNWRRWYAVINAANIFLERVPDVKAADLRYTDNNMAVDIAQIRVLRAFAYFYMARVWGDVPLITSSHDGEFEDRPREDADMILAWAEQEIVAVVDQLPFRYSQDEPEQPGNYYNEGTGRWAGALVRKLSAYAILAHIAAWREDYPGVAKYTQFVIENREQGGNDYTTTSSLTEPGGFFDRKGDRHILGFNFDYGHKESSFTGHIEELTMASPLVNKAIPDMYLPKPTILSIFDEIGDERFSLDTLGVPGPERYFANFNGKYPIFSKIKVIMGGSNLDNPVRIYGSAVVFTRLEDIALLRAEALAILGEQGRAIEMLDIIRELRGLNPYNAIINGDLIDAIFKERQRELMGEGHRWYDLVRYHRIRQQDPTFTHLINSGGIYWPIASSLLVQNPLLTQNAYWL